MRTQLNKQKPHPPNQETAFIFGNGTSRSKLDLNYFHSIGTTYGCNAQYREFNPHFLISVDVKMVNEIIASGYHKDNQVWTNPNKGINSKEKINFFNPHKGWSSGPTALWFASTHGHKEIYIFGFDYQGLNGKLNNVYADTFNYKKSTDSATFFGNWLNQTEKTIKEFPHIKYNRVIPDKGFIPDKLASLPNLKHMSFHELEIKFGNDIYLDKTNQNITI